MKIVRENINFERGDDPKKSMRIGSHRELEGQHLIDSIFANIYPELRDDPKFSGRDYYQFHDDVYNWIVAMVEDPDTGEIKTMWPGHITAELFREFWDEIYLESEEPTYRGL